MVSCVGIGIFTGFIFLIVLLFVAGSMDAVTNSAAGPLLQILYDATNNKAGAICLLMYALSKPSSCEYIPNWLKASACMFDSRYPQRDDNQQSHDLRFRTVSFPFKEKRKPTDICSDGGLPASRFFATVHPTLKLPLNALILTVVVVICFGCIFLGSSR